MTKYIDPSRSVSVNFKCPTELLAKMEERQIEERIDRTNLIIKCIESYLKEGRTKTETELLERSESIESILNDLQKTSQRHDEIVANLTATIAALTKGNSKTK